MSSARRFLAAVLTSLLLGACSAPAQPSAPAASGQPAAAAPSGAANSPANLVPASVRSSGVLTFGTDATYPPYEFYGSGNTLTGVDVELADAIAKQLSLTAQVSNIKFDSLIPAVQAGRFDVAISSMVDSPAREKILTFVDYLQTDISVLVQAGNPADLTPSTLCGHTVATEKGNLTSVVVVPQLNKLCATAGKPNLNEAVFPDNNSVVLAVKDGRAQASLGQSGLNAYIVAQSNGALASAGEVPNTARTLGIGVLKNDPGLANAIQAALNNLKANGTYQSILTKWGIRNQAVPQFAIDHPAS